MSQADARGLTSRQAWTLAHIARCGCCGAWAVLTEQEADLIADERYDPPAICEHLIPKQHRKAVA